MLAPVASFEPCSMLIIVRLCSSRAVLNYAQPQIVVKIFQFFKMLFSLKLGFSGFWEVPGRFKKLREACSKNFHLVAPSKTSVVTSYDQKTSELHDYLHHDYFHVSVHFPGVSFKFHVNVQEVSWKGSGNPPT